MPKSHFAPSNPARRGDRLAHAVAQTLSSREGVAGALGITSVEAREANAGLSMRLGRRTLNGHQTAHGGMTFRLADTAFAHACSSRNVATVAAQASILVLGPAREGGILIAQAREQPLRVVAVST